MKHLYICRHGQSELNAQQIYAGQLDTPLTDLGRQQAASTGSQAVDLTIDLIVASPLSRAQETAQIIAKAIDYPLDKIITKDIFKERSYGKMEGQPWAVDPADFNDVESEDSLRSRAIQGIHYLQTLDADSILVVGHGSYFKSLQEFLSSNDDPVSELQNAHIVQLF